MHSKRDFLGVRCEILHVNDLEHDENLVLIGGKEIALKKRHLGFFSPVEKFAVIGESPFFVKSSGILDFFGPSSANRFMIRVNSRGYLHELIIPERDVLFI